MQIGQSHQLARLGEEAGRGAAGGGPAVFVSGVFDVPHDGEAPALLPGRLVAETLERNRNLDLVTPVGQLSLRLPDEVGVQIGCFPAAAGVAAGSGFEQRSVHLDAVRVDPEDQRLPAVVEGAEIDLDVVVGADPVAVRQGGVDRPVHLEGADPEMNGAR